MSLEEAEPERWLSVVQYAADLNPGQAGLEKTRVLKKKPAQWVFLVFFYIFAQKREFLGFFQFQEYF
jgi:hypothetical protein